MKTKSKSTRTSNQHTTGRLKIRDLQSTKDPKAGACAKGEHLKDAVLTC